MAIDWSLAPAGASACASDPTSLWFVLDLEEDLYLSVPASRALTPSPTSPSDWTAADWPSSPLSVPRRLLSRSHSPSPDNSYLEFPAAAAAQDNCPPSSSYYTTRTSPTPSPPFDDAKTELAPCSAPELAVVVPGPLLQQLDTSSRRPQSWPLPNVSRVPALNHYRPRSQFDITHSTTIHSMRPPAVNESFEALFDEADTPTRRQDKRVSLSSLRRTLSINGPSGGGLNNGVQPRAASPAGGSGHAFAPHGSRGEAVGYSRPPSRSSSVSTTTSLRHDSAAAAAPPPQRHYAPGSAPQGMSSSYTSYQRAHPHSPYNPSALRSQIVSTTTSQAHRSALSMSSTTSSSSSSRPPSRGSVRAPSRQGSHSYTSHLPSVAEGPPSSRSSVATLRPTPTFLEEIYGNGGRHSPSYNDFVSPPHDDHYDDDDYPSTGAYDRVQQDEVHHPHPHYAGTAPALALAHALEHPSITSLRDPSGAMSNAFNGASGTRRCPPSGPSSPLPEHDLGSVADEEELEEADEAFDGGHDLLVHLSGGQGYADTGCVPQSPSVTSSSPYDGVQSGGGRVEGTNSAQPSHHHLTNWSVPPPPLHSSEAALSPRSTTSSSPNMTLPDFSLYDFGPGKQNDLEPGPQDKQDKATGITHHTKLDLSPTLSYPAAAAAAAAVAAGSTGAVSSPPSAPYYPASPSIQYESSSSSSSASSSRAAKALSPQPSPHHSSSSNHWRHSIQSHTPHHHPAAAPRALSSGLTVYPPAAPASPQPTLSSRAASPQGSPQLTTPFEERNEAIGIEHLIAASGFLDDPSTDPANMMPIGVPLVPSRRQYEEHLHLVQQRQQQLQQQQQQQQLQQQQQRRLQAPDSVPSSQSSASPKGSLGFTGQQRHPEETTRGLNIKKRNPEAYRHHDRHESFMGGFFDDGSHDHRHNNRAGGLVVEIMDRAAQPSPQPQAPPAHPFHPSGRAPVSPYDVRSDHSPSSPDPAMGTMHHHHGHLQQQYQQQQDADAASAKRYARWSQVTQSSVGSDYSAMTSNTTSTTGRTTGSSSGAPLWSPLVDRGPLFATVFEDEEALDSGALALEFRNDVRDPRDAPRDAWGGPRGEPRDPRDTHGALGLSTVPPPPPPSTRGPSARHGGGGGALGPTSSAATALSRVHRAPSSSVSSVSSSSAQQQQQHQQHLSQQHQQQHPFANRAPPPSAPAPSLDHHHRGSEHLARPIGAGQLPSVQHSRSSPSLFDQYNMTSDSPPPQVALLSPMEDQDAQECPVCCESLSSTYRLPGEKPHIVPECGHALHEECFVTVYGKVPLDGSHRNIGVCGVCRQQMRIGLSAGSDRPPGKTSKLASLTGGDTIDSPHHILQMAAMSIHGDEHESDDPLMPSSPTLGPIPLTTSPDQPVKVVVPKISIRSELPSVRRAQGGPPVLAMITIEVPPAADRNPYVARSRKDSLAARAAAASATEPSPQLPPSPISSYEATLPGSGSIHSREGSNSAFVHVQADLRRRVQNYKHSGLEVIGPLHLFDILKVKKGPVHRDFHVYLFQEAFVCIVEEKKAGGIGNIFRKETAQQKQGILKLKGRIYLRHVCAINDKSTKDEYVLTLQMESEVDGSDTFSICFQDRGSHEMWKSTLNRLVAEAKDPNNPNGQKYKLAQQLSRSNSTVSASPSGHSLTPVFNDHDTPAPPPCPAGCLGCQAYHVPLAPHHTPLDLVLVLSTPAPTSNNGSLPLKMRLMRTSLQFVLACMGPRDRISLVATELGVNGTVRRTPFLNATVHDSRRRLEMFVEALGTGFQEHDDFEVEISPDERQDVVTAVNVALDVILQRKVKNPLTGMIVISDTSELIKRSQMDLVTARLDAAKVAVHCLGYGKAHDPSPLWMISNHTAGTYTFVKEWYHLRDALAGVVGGLMSIALTNMKLRLTVQDGDFKIAKILGTPMLITSTAGKEIDVDLMALRHGERRELIVQFDLDAGDAAANEHRLSASTDDSRGSMSRHQGLSNGGTSVRSRPSINGGPGGGVDLFAYGGSVSNHQGYDESFLDEVPVVEVDCSFHDPLAGRSASRLANPVLLTLTMLPSSTEQSSALGDPAIIRRRMELLAADMMTRSLLIASRKNFGQAIRVLRDTKRIIETMADSLRANLPASNQIRSRRDVATYKAVEGLTATLTDVDMFLDGLEVNKEMFELDHRNYAAQQAVILRTQRSWTARTPTESNYTTPDVQALIQASTDYAARS